MSSRVLVIAGDRETHGPFRSAIDAIDSGLFRRRGIRTLGIAGYPQGHPRIGDDQLFRAMTEKIAAAETTGLAIEIVTQFCFDAQAILDYVARLRAFGLDNPVRVGLAGPTSIGSLLRYASRCGVRTSAQALARRAGLLRQMFTLTAPDDLIRTLAEAAPANVSMHFFSFGGVPATARWTRAVADGRVILDSSGGFSVALHRRLPERLSARQSQKRSVDSADRPVRTVPAFRAAPCVRAGRSLRHRNTAAHRHSSPATVRCR